MSHDARWPSPPLSQTPALEPSGEMPVAAQVATEPGVLVIEAEAALVGDATADAVAAAHLSCGLAKGPRQLL